MQKPWAETNATRLQTIVDKQTFLSFSGQVWNCSIADIYFFPKKQWNNTQVESINHSRDKCSRSCWGTDESKAEELWSSSDYLFITKHRRICSAESSSVGSDDLSRDSLVTSVRLRGIEKELCFTEMIHRSSEDWSHAVVSYWTPNQCYR